LAAVTLWHWIGFAVFVTVVLVLDLFVFHRRSRESTLREAAAWTLVWSSLALGFNVLIWRWFGRQAGVEFLTGYLVEWSLSMDNVFVFAVIFSFFRVPLKYQYRVLFWGILGAVIMRLTFVLVGAELIRHFEWVMWIFGAFLIYTGFKLAMHDEDKVDPSNNLLMRLARKVFPVAKGEHGEHFFVREGGRLCITPLFLVLLVVESTDVLFAVDSVPAIFGVVNKAAPYFTFVVFTSNVFAILGLRALYFLLAGVMDLFRYLSYGLSAVLVFVGGKMVADYFAQFETVEEFVQQNLWAGFHRLEEGHHLVPPAASLLVILSLLGISIIASLIAKWREPEARAEPETIDGPTPSPPAHPHSESQRPAGKPL
jgi:tellurite resistance protein TerC